MGLGKFVHFLEAFNKHKAALALAAEAELIPKLYAARTCTKPPPGWWCSRTADHEGPCAARIIPCDTR